MSLAYREDDSEFFKEKDLQGGIHVATLHPALIDRGSVETKIRSMLMSMAGNTVLVLYREGVVPNTRTFVLERWTAQQNVEITQADIRGQLAGIGEWLEITVPELADRMDEVMAALEDSSKAVTVRFGKKSS